ncbi:transmembrane protein 62-like [Amphiura filiformis]|uniref:transmembrane protein 62-like n=1 Tax=Amphiura filiformis TaxID=82378 RepID=UPI003B2123FA
MFGILSGSGKARYSRKTMVKVLGICTTILLLNIALLAWLWAIAVEHFTVPVEYNGPPHQRGHKPPYPGDTMDNLWWFIHISDIHISRFRDPSRTTDFQKFCTNEIDIIKPEVTIVTGDLTDAKDWDHVGSKQYEIEWKAYHNAIKFGHVQEKTVWIDIRGNHDAFKVTHKTHSVNYYRRYSAMGEKGDTTFMYQHKLPFGTYSFISVNAILDPGPGRPFNFFGYIGKDDIEKLEHYVDESHHSNHTMFFGHYPTSTIIGEQFRLNNALSQGIAYLCGHLHSLGGMIPNMKALQKTGSLELEVEDWKINRMYRVMAYDHDLLSFNDVNFGEWPVVLITNPKRARFMAPKHEPVDKMIHSTHIRFLLFSPSPITLATVAIDGVDLGPAKHVEGPLYVLPWEPAKFMDGLHTITVTAKNADGDVTNTGYRFSLDGSRPMQWFAASLFLMGDITCGLQFLCIFVGFWFVLSLPVVRWLTKSSAGYRHHGLPRSLVVLVHNNMYLYSILGIAIYPLIGPWCIGEIIQGHYGASTLLGLYVNGTFIPETFSYAVVFVDILLFQLPMTIYFALHLDCYQPTVSNGSITMKSNRRAKRPLCLCSSVTSFACLVSMFIWKIYLCYSAYACYGTLALFTSKDLWTMVFVLLLRSKLVRSKQYYREMNGNGQTS